MFNLGRGGGGRGGGRGGGKRPMPMVPPSLRPSTAPGAGRLSMGGGGGPRRPGTSNGAGGGGRAPAGKEENLKLLSNNELEFGTIVRLTPDLIEEIMRVESQEGAVKIKFGVNTNIPNGNVIDVGGKEFGFTWSRDELCDIYEEHRSGEGGDGLLVECGSSWRKLNVLRILDESTKQHVKKRSEEAERLSKARQSKLLDASTPSMKSHVQKMAAAEVEGNMRRTGWTKNFKRPKVDSNQVSNVGPPKSTFKLGASLNKTAKSVVSASPISPPPAASPFATGISSRDAYIEAITPPLDINKEHIDIGNFDKEMPNRNAFGVKHKISGHKGRTVEQPLDFQNSRGQKASVNSMEMSLKIEAAKKHLKPRVEVNSSARRESESVSSPEGSHDIVTAIESIFGEKTTDENYEHHVVPSPKLLVEDEGPLENIDIMQDIPDPVTIADKKVSNESEGKSSSSESGSDSDSESDSSGSDGGSQSRSRSRSKSPIGSASSSDSESDGSSSNEASDIDVNIMSSGDEKEEAAPKASPTVRASDNEQEQIDILGDQQIDILGDQQIDILGDQEEHVASLPVDLNDFGRDDTAEDTVNFHINSTVKTTEIPDVNLNASMGLDSYKANSGYSIEDLNTQFCRSPNDTREKIANTMDGEKLPILNDWSAREQLETTKKKKAKRGSGTDILKEKTASTTRYKGAKAPEVGSHVKRTASPEKARQDEYKSNNIGWGVNDIDFQDYNRSLAFGNTQKMQHSPEILSPSGVDAEHIGTKRKLNDRLNKNIERFPVHTDIRPNDNVYEDIQNESSVREKLSSQLKDTGPPSQIKKSDTNNKSPIVNVKGHVLSRELSELELGELREPLASNEFNDVKNSFRQSENKSASNDSSSLQRTKHYQDQKHLMVGHSNSEMKSHLESSAEFGRLQKTTPSLPPQPEIKHGGLKGYKTIRESKQQKEKLLENSTCRSSNDDLLENGSNDRKRREYHIESDNSFFSKYDKEVPELRDPIKDFSQYNDYVQEYREKYDCYISLNKNLEKIRNEFLKVSEELEHAKGGCSEEYYKVIRQLREMYNQHGEKNKQMKRVFVVLHEELKTLKQRIQDFVDVYTSD